MNTTKLKSVLCRAAAGEELTIGFLGCLLYTLRAHET